MPFVNSDSMLNIAEKCLQDGLLRELTKNKKHLQAYLSRFMNHRWDWKRFNKLRIKQLQLHTKTAMHGKGIWIIDDTLIEKSGRFMHAIKWIKGRKHKAAVLAYRTVFLHYADKKRSYPIDYRVEPKKGKTTKLEQALAMITCAIKELKLPVRRVVFDSLYFSVEFCKGLRKLHTLWVTKSKRNKYYMVKGKRMQARDILKLGIEELEAELEGYGKVKLVRRKIKRKWYLLVTNGLHLKADTVRDIHKRRFAIDNPFFRESKQKLGLEDFHMRKANGIRAHFYIAMLRWTVATVMKLTEKKLRNRTIGWIKRNVINVSATVRKGYGSLRVEFNARLPYLMPFTGTIPPPY